MSKILNKSYKFTFGKYKGSTIEYIAETNPSYIIWVSENIEWVTIDEEIVTECRKMYANSRYHTSSQSDDWGGWQSAGDDWAYGGCDPNMWG